MPPLAAAWSVATQDTWPFLFIPVAIALAIFGMRRTTPPLHGGRRTLLIALRSVAYTLLLVVLASPVLNRDRTDPQKARIAVLVDESASMSTIDAPDEPPRITRARQALSTLRDALRGDDVQMEVVPFATEAGAPLAPDEYLARADSAAGSGTDVLQALGTTADRLAGENLQALVLLTDGRPTRGAIDPGRAAGLDRPVFAVGFGDTLPPVDLALGRIDVNPIAYLDSEIDIGVRVEHSGVRGRGTTLRLVQEGREIARESLRFDQDRGRAEARLPLRLTTPGRQRYQILLDPLSGERTTRNNAREIRIEVLKNRLRVLVLAPKPDWDVAFLARTLRADPTIQPTVAHRDASGGWIASETGRSFALPRGPAWGRDWDLVVVANAGRELDGTVATDIAAAVSGGRGLLVLAGRELPSGAWSSLLPVAPGRGRGPRYGTTSVRLAPQGRTHPTTASLAALAGADGGLGAAAPLLGKLDLAPKPGALVLLATADDPPVPCLAVARHGQGQTAVLNGFPWWRWGLTDRAPVRQASTEFVGALVRWLVQPRDVQPVQLTVPKNVFESGEPVDFTAQVLDPQLEPLADAEVRVDVRRTDDSGRTEGTLALEGRAGHAGEYTGVQPGLGPGEYEATATATRAGREIGRATVKFTIDVYSAEFADTRQDLDFLRELAARTGGKVVGASQVASLAEILPRAERRVVVRSEVDVWNTTPLFVLFVVALGAEWLLRKRWGLL